MPTKTLGQGLRTARDVKKLSLRQVEEATGISNAYLSQLENNQVKKPSPHFLHKLAALYDIPYEVLMENAGYLKQSEKVTGPRSLAGAALYSQKNLTDEEADALGEYLAFLRSRKK
jgi:transcriptional regulator with XRE-family HTH domain